MTDREKKIAEIREWHEGKRDSFPQFTVFEAVGVMLDEIDRIEREYAEERAAHNAHVAELCELESKIGELDNYHRMLHARNERLERELEQLREKQRWISVEERLPEPGVPVLVYVPETADEYAYYTIDVIDPDSDGDIWIKHYEHYEWAESVALPGATGVPKEKAPYTHWQPLPEPPEEG